jgi:ribulose-phosphate 3-epimerase
MRQCSRWIVNGSGALWRTGSTSGKRKTYMSSKVRIAASILSADFGRLADEVRAAEAAGADWIHVDVMDGVFVPNITFGPGVVEIVRSATRLPVDVHLMIVEPDRHVDAFAEAGADRISVHVEAAPHLQRTLTHLRSLGKRAGVVLNPHTSEETIRYVLDDIDLVLVMTVNPGFGGQEFLPAMLPKIRRVRELIDGAKHPIELEVDGGIAPETAKAVVDAGARVLVAGNAVFGQPDRAAAIGALRAAAG